MQFQKQSRKPYPWQRHCFASDLSFGGHVLGKDQFGEIFAADGSVDEEYTAWNFELEIHFLRNWSAFHLFKTNL